MKRFTIFDLAWMFSLGAILYQNCPLQRWWLCGFLAPLEGLVVGIFFVLGDYFDQSRKREVPLDA